MGSSFELESQEGGEAEEAVEAEAEVRISSQEVEDGEVSRGRLSAGGPSGCSFEASWGWSRG